LQLALSNSSIFSQTCLFDLQDLQRPIQRDAECIVDPEPCHGPGGRSLVQQLRRQQTAVQHPGRKPQPRGLRLCRLRRQAQKDWPLLLIRPASNCLPWMRMLFHRLLRLSFKSTRCVFTACEACHLQEPTPAHLLKPVLSAQEGLNGTISIKEAEKQKAEGGKLPPWRSDAERRRLSAKKARKLNRPSYEIERKSWNKMFSRRQKLYGELDGGEERRCAGSPHMPIVSALTLVHQSDDHPLLHPTGG
jgi:hypothetical protein